MEPNVKLLFFLLLIGFTTSSCEENSLSDEDKNSPAIDVKAYENLEFIYRVTDMDGNSRSTFAEGENFVFSFIVKNHGNENVFLDPWNFPVVIEDFFAVYRKNTAQEGKERIGKSFTIGGNSRDLLSQQVPKKGEIEYRMPWLTQKDTAYIMPLYRPRIEDIYNKRRYLAVEPLPIPLSSGEYYSGFTFEYKEEEITFTITFSIE